MKKCRVNAKGYTIIDLLGTGSYGSVYKVCPILAPGCSSQETLAVKCIERQLLARIKSAEDCMINEIGILKILKHPNIVELKDFSWDDKYIYLVLEYCPLGDLSKMLARHRRLSEEITRHFLRQVATALSFLRNYNISHFDLKPQNILLTCNPHVTLKLADFGFATVISSREFMAGYRGTPLYMAPEILLRHMCIPKADLWSVGIMLYECLFGVTPFVADSLAAMTSRLRSVRYVPLPKVPISKECADLLSKLLRADPAERIDFAHFFSHPFINIRVLPSDLPLKTSTAKIERAIKAERAQNWQRAIDFYCEALEDIMPSLGHVHTETDRAELRSCAFRCLHRAEELKALVRKSGNAVGETTRLATLWADNPQVQACLLLALSADSLAAEGKLTEAVEKYNLIILSAQVVLAMSVETSSEKNNLLRERIRQWEMKRDTIKCSPRAVHEPTSKTPEANVATSSSATRYESWNKDCIIM